MQDTFVMEQLAVFAVVVILGLSVGFSFDVLRLFQRYIRLSRSAQFFADLLFWLTATVFVFLALMASNWGEVRAYVFIGLAAGGGLYRLVLSRPCYQGMVKTADALIKIFRTVARPVFAAYRAIRRIVLFVAGKGNRTALSAQKKANNFLQKFKRKKKE